MTTTLRRTSWVLATTALFAVSTASAQNDRIVLKDGTVLDNVTVRSFDLRNVEFRKGGSNDTRAADLVASMDIERVKDTYRRAYAAANSDTGPGEFLSQAERETDAFLKQFGYYEAAMLFAKGGQWSDAFTVLENLQRDLPDSGFLPVLYQMKLDYYLGKGKGGASNAVKVAKEYETAALSKGFPQGSQLEAKYYGLLADAAAGSVDAKRLQSQMRALAGEAAAYKYVADRARLAIADSLRGQKDYTGAQSAYEELLDKEGTSEAVRAGAWLGQGLCQFNAASAANKDLYRQALLSFLRVYLETPNAPASMIAEALRSGSEAAKKWGGDDASRMAAILEYRLETYYPEFAGDK